MLKILLDKLPDEALVHLTFALDNAFFYTIHFGDADMMTYLLDRGVSPHAVSTHRADQKQMPLVLIIDDLNRCVLRMQKRVENVSTGKLLRGTLEDLQRVFSARLCTITS